MLAGLSVVGPRKNSVALLVLVWYPLDRLRVTGTKTPVHRHNLSLLHRPVKAPDDINRFAGWLSLNIFEYVCPDLY
jgi:hypothetical protein